MAILSLALAQQCIQRGKLKAKELGIKSSIAVVNNAGELIAYIRMREMYGGFDERKTIAKARTAAYYAKDTKAIMQEYSTRSGNYFIVGMSAIYPEAFWAGPGGVPILMDGEVVGGVGVSGSSPENDHSCAQAAVCGAELK